jgi:hypothetical protein
MIEYVPPPWVLWLTAGVWGAIAVAVMGYALIITHRAHKARTAIDPSIKAQSSPVEDWLTRTVATIATGVSAEGMWRFTRDVLKLEGPLQIALFAFIELSMVTEAVRARRNMREHHSAGLDGIAVWALACLTAVLSSMDARQPAEAVFRLAAPLVAAWMWERGMRLERRRRLGTKGINWRLTPERLLVWLGVAEAHDRTASEVDTHRRLKRVALAAKRVHQLQSMNNPNARKVAAAVARRGRMLDKAVEHTDLATNPRTQAVLLDLATTLGGAEDLTALLASARAPWRQLDHPAITGAARQSEAAQLAAETRKLTEAVLSQRDPDAAATIEMLSSMLVGRRIPPPGSDTGERVSPSVADLVAGRMSLRAVSAPPDSLGSDTASDTAGDTSRRVSDEVSDDEVDAIIAQLCDEEGDTGDDTEAATPSATEAMRRYFDAEISKGRVPSGPELAEVGRCGDSYARRKRKDWLDGLDGRTRRRLVGQTPRRASA